MPKYWRKQIFTHGSFPEVDEKQKTERKIRREKKERLNDGNNNGHATHSARKHAWCTQAAWRMQARMALTSRLGQNKRRKWLLPSMYSK